MQRRRDSLAQCPVLNQPVGIHHHNECLAPGIFVFSSHIAKPIEHDRKLDVTPEKTLHEGSNPDRHIAQLGHAEDNNRILVSLIERSHPTINLGAASFIGKNEHAYFFLGIMNLVALAILVVQAEGTGQRASCLG
ncbi:hypothetical protein LLG95_03055 [bacterium]|nr:hypothetical protein [bacterium]